VRSFGFDLVGKSLEDIHNVAPGGFDNVIDATEKVKIADNVIGMVRLSVSRNMQFEPSLS
jgi:hypothetical protein